MGMWYAENLVGKDHPLFRGGDTLYMAIRAGLPDGAFSPQKRKRIRDFFNHTCLGCGAQNAAHERSLDVHHVIPVLAGGTNADELLIPLCVSCHTKADAYMRTLPEAPALIDLQ
jgi:5-methylcytosine-specific restriction endonuclease McrA